MRSRLLHEPVRLAGASLLRLQSDERLAALARAGHEPAFAAIVHRYQAPLLRYCAGIVGPARAEDAVQQAFINAHDALPRTTEVRHLKSWLHRIAHNVSLNTLRAARDEVALDAGQVALDARPDDAYESTERLRATLQAVRDLPERQRAALVLRELEGRSHDEIAAALGTTAGGARQQLMRARAAVRQAATAITPYPLIARLADAVADPNASRVAEAVAGAGAGATIVKLTAGLAATGALVGGVVGTEKVVRREADPPAAIAREAAPRAGATPAAGIRAAIVASPAGLRATGAAGSARSEASSRGRHRGEGEDGRGVRSGTVGGDREHRSGSGDDDGGGRSGDDRRSGSSGSSSSGSDSRSGDDRRERERDHSGSSGTSGSGGGDSLDDHEESSGTSGSGTSGSGSDDLTREDTTSGDHTETQTTTTSSGSDTSGGGSEDDGLDLHSGSGSDDPAAPAP